MNHGEEQGPDDPSQNDGWDDGLFAGMYWWSFERALLRTNRIDPGLAFVDGLVEGCISQVRDLRLQVIYRARIHPIDRNSDQAPLVADEIGAPRDSGSGRLNAAGIRCLYAAFEVDTAIAEIQPWREALVSVGAFALSPTVSVVDLRAASLDPSSNGAVRYLAAVLGRPVHRQDPNAYLATQFVADKLKARGVEGILYDSSLCPGGTNVAMFGKAIPSLPLTVWVERVATAEIVARPASRGRWDASNVLGFLPQSQREREITFATQFGDVLVILANVSLPDGLTLRRWFVRDPLDTIWLSGIELPHDATEETLLPFVEIAIMAFVRAGRYST